MNTNCSRSVTTVNTDSISSFKLIVSADDMETVEEPFTGETVSLEVDSGEARTFTLYALDASGNTMYSGSTVKDLTAGTSASISIDMSSAVPDAPENVAVTIGSKQLSVSWDAVSNAASYEIYYSTENDVTTASSV
ncbi:MAG: hypothetical protein PQJ46_09890, partial [Spirochaetales bacterium]|nr:hypothetical protein [Spirochaetales bacterium]